MVIRKVSNEKLINKNEINWTKKRLYNKTRML